MLKCHINMKLNGTIKFWDLNWDLEFGFFCYAFRELLHAHMHMNPVSFPMYPSVFVNIIIWESKTHIVEYIH